MINEIRKIILLVFLLVPYNLIAESEINDKNLVCAYNSGKDIYFFIIDIPVWHNKRCAGGKVCHGLL